MKKQTIYIGVLLLLISACQTNNSQSSAKFNLYLVQELSSDNLDFYFMGEETIYAFREIIQDRSVPDVSRRVSKLFNVVEQLEKETGEALNLIHGLQLQLIKNAGGNVNQSGTNSVIVFKEGRDKLRPITFDLSKIPNTESANSLSDADKKNLATALAKLRKSYSEMLASSSGTEERSYFFKDPQISSFNNFEDLDNHIRKAIASSNVSPDDQDALRMIYSDLTGSMHFATTILNENKGWSSDFGSLMKFENDILKLRIDLLRTLRSRSSGDNYSFNKILPVANGPEAVKAGSGFQVKVFMAALDSDKQPVVTINGGGQLIETRDGMGIIQVNAPSANGKIKLNGTITVLNKSGISKTLPWEKEIVVVK